MRAGFVFFGWMVLALAPATALAHQSVHYEIRYVADEAPDAPPWLEITATFESDGSGLVSLYIPTSIDRDRRNQSRITDLEVVSEFSELTDHTYQAANQYTLYHAPDMPGIIRYRLHGLAEELQSFAAPWQTSQIVTRGFVHLDASAALAIPSWGVDGYDWDEDVSVRITWHDLPTRWTTADSFGHGREPRRFHSSVIDLFESRLVAGPFRVSSRFVGGSRIQVAVLGRWDFTPRQYARAVTDIAWAHHEFWNDEDQAGYLATLIPIESFLDAEITTALAANADLNASSIFTSRGRSLSQIRSTISHEYLHRWIEAAFGMPEPPIEASRWFTEGFTNFFAAYVPFRAGVIDELEFLLWHGDAFAKRDRAPQSGVSQDEMVEGWSFNSGLASVPYWQGHLLAANWQARIVADTDGAVHLQDVLFEFREAQDQLRARGEPWVWSSESLVEIMEGRGFDFARRDYQTVLLDGEPLEVGSETAGPCLVPVLREHDNRPSEGLTFGGVSFPFGPVAQGEMSRGQRAACRVWLDLD